MATTCPRMPSSAPLTVFLLSLLILQLHNHECKTDDDPIIPAEKDALILFREKAIYDKSKVNWYSSEHVCTWTGVTCTLNKTVTYLQLPAKSLVGAIPANTIGRLIGLRGLSLRGNKLSGNLPDDFSNLTSLTRLSLENNSFSGNIPSYFSNFTSLVLLTLNDNSFTGKIPDIRSEKLSVFSVSNNKLEGAIPPSLAKFHRDNFTQNNLSGCPLDANCNTSSQGALPQKNKQEKKDKKTPKIVGISIGSGVVLLILLCCIQRKTCSQTPKSPSEPKVVKVEKNKLVVFDNHGFNSFDVEDLLKASEEVLGEGSVGRSYKQVLEGKNVTVVVKRLKHVVVTENEFRITMEVLGKMKNEYVVPLIGYYYSQDEKWLVYAYMDAGSLYDRLHGSIASRQTQLLDWNHRMRIAIGCAKGVAYLHEDNEKSVIHGNIHSSNILLQEKTNIEAMVSDYGLNTLFDVKCSQNHHGTGYWAPEVENARAVTFKSDVYSFGVLLLELLTSKIPKKASLGKGGDLFSKLLESVVCGESNDEIFDVRLRMGHNIEEMRQFLQIAKECLSIEPNQRPSMKDVVRKMEVIWPRHMPDDHSKGSDYTPSTETGDTPSTITYDTPSTITP
ncbi:hypothetical protein M8C21_023199 [Ambrosia artemisiifolia]|uniref:Protein kinase domain-containing protein n=1 Tax=Ambrosia artemisiifolia TaxID=4212 RepID=A0AAD5C0J7_AMBAR|nr:hypothetical protein M8C21_023199 [Ambrosia artemisiifolia]